MKEILVMYGNNPQEMVLNVLEKIRPELDIRKYGKNPLIGIKPNLVVPQPAHWGATTSPELVEGTIKYLQNKGFSNIIILESSWVGDSTKEAFQVCGYESISKKFNIRLVDLKDDNSQEVCVDGMKLNVCKQALKIDYLINIPVLKAHCQTKITCALKNLKGCIPDNEKKRFHTMGLHSPIAYLNKVLKSNLILVDGIIGDLTYEGGGTPVRMDRIIAGKDPVLIDSYAAQLLGYSPEEIKYIKIAEKIAIGNSNIEAAKILELNKNKIVIKNNEILASEKIDYLQKWIISDSACSGCFGSVFFALKRLQEEGKLQFLKDKIYLGQAFRNSTKDEIGVGTCTKEFKKNIPGCPPTAKKILSFLDDYLQVSYKNKHI